MHGVSLSIGSTSALDLSYLDQVKALADQIEAHWVSDHLCWTGTDSLNLHDLMPIPFTEEALQHVVARVSQVQEHLQRRILLENVSSYVTYQCSELTEWDFLREVAERADCLLLLDVNNVYVSSVNHGFDADTFLQGIPVHRVQQFHLAGHSNLGSYLIDTHDAPVAEAVWSLYAAALQRFGNVSTMIERDANIPALPELLEELGGRAALPLTVRRAQHESACRFTAQFSGLVLEGDTAIAEDVHDSPLVPVATRLNVYADAYRLRLIEALQSNYPMLHQVLGDDVFEQLASGYIAFHPSRFRSIRWFGDQLAVFLAESPDWSQHGWLQQFAQWEWAIAAAFDAADAQLLEPAMLGSVAPEDWPSLQFEAHPSIHRMNLQWNVPAMFKALLGEEMPPEPAATAPAAWLIWRQALTTQYRLLPPAEAAALEVLIAGGSLRRSVNP